VRGTVQNRLEKAFIQELQLARNESLPEDLRKPLDALWTGLGDPGKEIEAIRRMERQKAVQLVGQLLVAHDTFERTDVD
jgi:hypothetical protein